MENGVKDTIKPRYNLLKRFVSLVLITVLSIGHIPIFDILKTSKIFNDNTHFKVDWSQVDLAREIFAANADGTGSTGSGDTGGGSTFTIAEGVRFTIIDYNTGEALITPVDFFNQAEYNKKLANIPKIYGYYPTHKTDYQAGDILELKLLKGDNEQSFALTTDKWIGWYFIEAGGSSLEPLKKMFGEDRWLEETFFPEFYDGAKALGYDLNDATSVNEFMQWLSVQSWRIMIEPIAVWRVSHGQWPYPDPAIDYIATTVTEVGMYHYYEQGQMWDNWGNVNANFYASSAPSPLSRFTNALWVEEDYDFTLYPLYSYNPYANTPKNPANSNHWSSRSREGYLHKEKSTAWQTNLAMVDFLGVMIVTPDAGAPSRVNYRVNKEHFEAEYLPSTNQARVKVSFAIDGMAPYKCYGFEDENLYWMEPYGKMSEIQKTFPNEDNLPTYQAGRTKTHLYIQWGSKDGVAISHDDGIKLYMENSVQFKNPEKIHDDIIIEGEYIHGEPAWISVEGSTGSMASGGLNYADPGVHMEDGEDNWIYFNLPPIPPGEEFLTVIAGVNTPTFHYLNSALNGRASAPSAIEDDELAKFRIYDDTGTGELIEIDCIETNLSDNVAMLRLDLPTFNLKAGGSDKSDPVKLEAQYNNKDKEICVAAPGIFDSMGLTARNEDEEGAGSSAPPENPLDEPIATSHKVSIHFRDAGETPFSNGQVITHEAGQTVELDGELKSFTKYIPNWKFDEATKWTSNIRYFGSGDLDNGNLSTGDKLNLRETYQYYDISGGGSSSRELYCIDFPYPTKQTAFIVRYEINPTLQPDLILNPEVAIPDGETTYIDNIAEVPLTIGPEVNFRAVTVTGELIPSAYKDGQGDYSQPYSIAVKGGGYLERLVGFEEMSTEARLYIAPDTLNGINPFTDIQQLEEGGHSYQLPVNSGRQVVFEEGNNDVLGSGALGSQQGPMEQHPDKKLGDKVEQEYTFTNLSGDFLVSPEKPFSRIWFAYYINPTNEQPGVPDGNGLPREVTYTDNIVTGYLPIYLAPTAPEPGLPINKHDPFLNCSIYINQGGNRSYVVSDLFADDTWNTTAMLEPGIEIHQYLNQDPYGAQFTVEMPFDTPWGFKNYQYVYWGRADYLFCCGVLETIEESDYPPDYWKTWVEYGDPNNIKNQVVTKYMTNDKDDGGTGSRAVVKTQVVDYYKMHSSSESHCACGDHGDCGCEDPPCDCTGTYWWWEVLAPTQATTYNVLFDNIYTNHAQKSRVFSVQGKNTAYDYMLAAGYGVSAVIRTRFATDYQPGYAALEAGGAGKSSNGKDFSMEGAMKFSMSSSSHNMPGHLTNGGYPLEQTETANQQVVTGTTELTTHNDVLLKWMFTGLVGHDANNKMPLYAPPGQELWTTSGSVWSVFTKNPPTENGYVHLWYFKLEPVEQKDSQGNMERIVYTNKNYPDAVKINNMGQPMGRGKLPDGYVPSEVEKQLGYVGLKVWNLGYINNRYPDAGASGNYQPVMGICYVGQVAIIGSYENDAWVRPADWS